MKKHLFFLFTIIISLYGGSCTSEREQPGIDIPASGEGEIATLSVTVELETDEERTRAAGEDLGFGKGQKINTLTYALYTQQSSLDPNIEGEINPVKLKLPAGALNQYDNDGDGYANLVRVIYNPSENSNIQLEGIEIVKGIEYTLMLWAQYRPENETEDRVYFELGNNGIIRILNSNTNPFPNNDDQRDVFCAVYKIVQYEDTRELKLTLRRPFAQLNIGIPERILKRGGYFDENGKLLIENSSITISGDIANRYNLFKNQAEKENNQSYTRTFGMATIPSLAQDNGWTEGKIYIPLRIKDRDTHETKDYVWLSMCYILPDGKLGDVSEIDIQDFNFTYTDKNNNLQTYIVEKNATDKQGNDVFLAGVPALRNRRTNIILRAEDIGLVTIPWYAEEHEEFPPTKDENQDNLFKELIENYFFMFDPKYPSSNDEDFISNILTDFASYILVDDNGYYNIMLGEGDYIDSKNILPIHRSFILYGKGEETIIKKDANSNTYHNIGQVRNLLITDKNNNKQLFIDKDGWAYRYINGEKEEEPFYQLTPLTGNNRSYDVYFDGSDRSHQSDYYR